MTDPVTSGQQAETRERKGLLARHPRLGIFLIGVLFILPLCAMIVTVAVLIVYQIMNA